MAFCPHCGKPTTKEATKCIACGKDLEGPKKGRFAGTMMMSASDAAVDAGLKPPSVRPPPAVAPAPAPAPMPPPTAAAVPAPTPKKLQATMIGTGLPGPGAGAQPAAARSGAALPAAASAASQARTSEAFADTAPRAQGETAHRTEPGMHAQEPKYLVGDPMAPSPQAHAAARRSSAQKADRASASSTQWLVVIFLGLAIIGGLGYAAAVFLGLI